MSKLTVSEIKDTDFGNMLLISNGIVELKAALDFGPRILSYSLTGHENMLYEDRQKKTINDVAYDEFDGEILRVCGGHRLWVSPEIMPRCYYPDSSPVKVHEIEGAVVLEGEPEKFNNIQKFIEIRLNEYNSEVTVVNSIKNLGAWNTVFSPWAITMMDKGGLAVIPFPDRETGLLSNRYLGLWSYSKMNDERVYWGEKFITLQQKAEIKQAFKVGINNEKGWQAYFNKNQLFVKKYEHLMDSFYSDFAECSCEVYTNGDFLELESLGPIGLVEPGKSVSHTEKWSLYVEAAVPNTDEHRIEEVLKNYL